MNVWHGLSALFLLPLGVAAADFPKFDVQVIDSNVGEVCYGVTVADVNSDGKPDIVAVNENAVLWYENPSWKKRIVVQDAMERDYVCLAAADIDGDSQVDFAVGSGWPSGEGAIHWVSRGKSLEEMWQVHRIGNEPSLHRMRFADVLGKGRPQLVISPLNKFQAAGVRLIAFEIPSHPEVDRWPPTVLDQGLDRMHNHWHADFDDDRQIDTLTASEDGIHLIRREGTDWTRAHIARGNVVGFTKELTGAGEIKTGTFEDGRRFIATIEPMHGNQVVVYAPDSKTNESNPNWARMVLDDTLKRGHALWVADMNNDHKVDIIVGHSDAGAGSIKGPGIYIYAAQDSNGLSWEKHVLDDGGIATEDALAADLNGDGWMDIVAGGRATHNLKLYLNRGLAQQ